MMPEPALSSVPASAIKAFLNAAHATAAKGLVLCSSGNLSCRLDDERLLIKGSRAWMERLEPRHLAVCRIADGVHLEGAKPSVEMAFHAGILRVRPEAKVVLHFQSPFATVIACRRDLDALRFDVTPEMPYYIGSVGVVPFHMPGSPELAVAVVAAAANHHLLILRNHGQVTFGNSFRETLQRAVFFEMTCALLVRAGDRLQPLDPAESTELARMGQASKPV